MASKGNLLKKNRLARTVAASLPGVESVIFGAGPIILGGMTQIFARILVRPDRNYPDQNSGDRSTFAVIASQPGGLVASLLATPFRGLVATVTSNKKIS